MLNVPTPAGLTLISAGCGAGFPCLIGDVAPGASSTVTTTFDVPAAFAGSSTTVQASATSPTPDSDPTNETFSRTVAVSDPDDADVLVSISPPLQVVAGTTAEFTILVSNNGPAQATNVILAAPVPTGLLFLSASAPCASGFPCALGDLTAGQSTSVVVRFTVPPETAAGIVIDTASVTATSSDPAAGNNSTQVQTSIVRISALRLDSQESPDPVILGGIAEILEWRLVLTNDGPSTSDAPIVNVGMTLPANETFESADVATFNLGVWSPAPLGPGESTTLTLRLSVNPGAAFGADVIQGTAQIVSGGVGVAPVNNAASFATTVQSAGTTSDVAVTLSAPPERRPRLDPGHHRDRAEPRRGSERRPSR